MSEHRVSGRYAKSLIDLAIANNCLEAIKADILAFKKAIEENSSLAKMFKSPIVKGDKKQAIVHQIFGSSFNKLTLDFMDIVIRKNREYYLPDMAVAFIGQYNEINKITTASVKTAVAISDAVVNEVREFIEKQTGKKVILETQVDADIIGGLVIQMEDKLYDASISGKLKKAKQDLLNTYISK
ncbi:MAG: ATP synthase F1 subunit delta [Bacteroidia bacterium]|nr:ATP synthase F1 subunit delta [Bacteroidia bacterium]MCF8427226.1 ATP synthase F1 subunit delta [Bacteroidia bacterium]MCF8446424.1 ATP synthase F1 subunit delta [Bacteroidia bacterium]